ncbi:hypothetical protein ACFYPC_28030 [Streptomyces sp. NPDC005808]|uniref:hypothetical protein n=1 Tax=Streptomyces sp. NPDC005808 TaxID=3364734 RepID=UPI0036B541F0
MAEAEGIDLGTTSSVIAVGEGGESTVVRRQGPHHERQPGEIVAKGAARSAARPSTQHTGRPP